MLDRTMTFSLGDDKEQAMKVILTTVYDALREKGYNPINQLVGYLLLQRKFETQLQELLYFLELIQS